MSLNSGGAASTPKATTSPRGGVANIHPDDPRRSRDVAAARLGRSTTSRDVAAARLGRSTRSRDVAPTRLLLSAQALENTGGWCKQGWDVETAMCSGEVDGFFYIDVQAIKCPGSHTRDAEAWVFSMFCFLLLLLLFILINDVVRPNFPVFDAVLLTYQDIGSACCAVIKTGRRRRRGEPK